MGDTIYLLPDTNKVRSRPYLRVSIFTNAPANVSNYHKTTFLDMTAYEETVLRAGKGDYFTYQLYVTNRDRWYAILYQIPADSRSPSITNLPKMMIPYLQSFKPIP